MTKRSVLILANKRLTHNTRIERQVRSLKAAGLSVRVCCLAPPHASVHPEAYTTVSIPAIEALKPIRDRAYAFLASLKNEIAPGGGPASAPRLPLMSRASFPMSYLLESWGFAAAVKRLGSLGPHTVVQAHDHFALQAAHALAARWDARLLYDAVELPYALTEAADQALFRPAARALVHREKRMLQQAGIITVSPGLSEFIARGYGVPAPAVVRNCSLTCTTGGPGIRQDIGIPIDHVLVVYVNSILPGRGIRTILDAAAMLPGNTHFAFLGPTPDRPFFERIRQRAAALNGRIHFPTQVRADELSTYISSADLGVIATRSTNRNLLHCLPNRLFEMIMAGLPLVVSDLPDMRKLVLDHGLGLIFRQGEVESLHRALAKALAPDTRASLVARTKHARKRLCWEVEQIVYTNAIEFFTSNAPTAETMRQHQEG